MKITLFLYLYVIAEKRMVGLVMIPGKHLVKIETEDLELPSSMYT